MDHKIKKTATLWVLLTLAVSLNSVIMGVSSSPTTTFKVEPPNSTARTGETFTVDVRIYEASYLYSWQVYMNWTTGVLELYNLVFGGFLADQQPDGSSTNIRIEPNFCILGEATIGSYQGVNGNGLLVSITFRVLTDTSTTLGINHPTFTKYYECFSPPQLNLKTDFNKENGYFFPPWVEDINADGIIDIFDISCIGIDWGRFKIQTNSPTGTSGTWDWGDYAYASDNYWASTTTKNAEQIYSSYGFDPSSWTSVSKVEVGLEIAIDAGGNNKVTIAVSGDGSSYGAAVDPGTPPEAEGLIWVDVTGTLAWTPSMLNDANFRVKMTYISVGGGSGAETIYVDWIPVRVTPQPAAYNLYTDLNADGVVDIVDLSMVAVKFGEIYAG